MKHKTLRANILLLLAAVFWGSTFAAQRVSVELLPPFAFQGIRCTIGALVLLPVIVLFDRIGQKGSWKSKKLWFGGIVCGLVLFLSTNLQQFGLSLGTTAGKSGFITAMYIILVPILSLFLRKKIGRWVWLSVILAACGLYLLCMKESMHLSIGDALTLGCALCFAVHIIVVDLVNSNVDPIRLSCIQFLVCGILSLIAMSATDIPSWKNVADCWFPLAYAAILSSAVAYTLQIIGQRDTNPTVAALIMSTESVFACLSGWLVLHEQLSLREAIGCAIMFCAVLLAQLPGKKQKTA